MLGFWSQKRDPGEVTPKASAHLERNPFEHSLSSNNANSSGLSSSNVFGVLPGTRSVPHSRKNSVSSLHSIPAGLRTPTLQKSFVLPEVTGANATSSHTSHTFTGSAASSLHQAPANLASSSYLSGKTVPVRAHSHQLTNPHHHPSPSPNLTQPNPEFKLSQPPPEDISAPSCSKVGPSQLDNQQQQQQSQQQHQQQQYKQPPVSSSSNATVSHAAAAAHPAAPPLSTTSSSPSPNHKSTSSSSTFPSHSDTSSAASISRKRRDTSTSSLRGKLTVKIMEARTLTAPSPNSRPYVVATFEQNEFISREAINEHEADATGHPVSPQSSSALRKREKTGKNGNVNGNGSAIEGESMDTSTASAYNPVWKHEVVFDLTTDSSPVTVCVYDRSEGNEEAFLGMVDIKPRLSHGWSIDDWFSLHPRQDEHVSGDVRVRMRFEKSETRRTLRASDFEFLRMIGKGTFGRVFQVRKKDTKRIYAMKVLSKREIIAKKEVQHTIGERKILQRSSECPFLLGLKFSFQSEMELFLVMDFKSGGELFHHLQKEGRFTEDRARFYAAEITLAFEYLHRYNIVYRDLKPENILLDATGHIVLCDFGLSKPDLPSNALTNTFCGTTEYLAPEVLLDDHGYSQTVDFWSLGVLLFEMCCGWSPFYAEDTQQMYKNICFGKIKFPRGVIGDDGKQFVKGLLNRNPAHRLGAKRDAAELKEHLFFSMIDWDALAARQVAVPFKPFVDSDESVSNFDPEFTEADVLKEAPIDAGTYFDDNDPSGAWLDPPSSGPYTMGGGAGQKPTPLPINPSKDRMTGTGPLDEQAQNAFRGFSYSGDTDLHDLMHQANIPQDDEEEAP